MLCCSPGSPGLCERVHGPSDKVCHTVHCTALNPRLPSNVPCWWLQVVDSAMEPLCCRGGDGHSALASDMESVLLVNVVCGAPSHWHARLQHPSVSREPRPRVWPSSRALVQTVALSWYPSLHTAAVHNHPWAAPVVTDCVDGEWGDTRAPVGDWSGSLSHRGCRSSGRKWVLARSHFQVGGGNLELVKRQIPVLNLTTVSAVRLCVLWWCVVGGFMQDLPRDVLHVDVPGCPD